jgi:alkylhydroperoxidase family enzyme
VTETDLSAQELRVLAPEPFNRWDVVAASLSAATAPDRSRQIRILVASLLGADTASLDLTTDEITDIVQWRSSDRLAASERAVLEFAEQFVLDVSSCTPDQRSRALSALGADAFGFVQMLYVVDLGTRTHAAWHQLFGTDPGVRSKHATELWPTLESFMSAVARLRSLDPLTTEIVRLRGARAHNCRLCKSLRNVRAANDGADESIYDQIDHYETSALSDRHQTALRLVDAMLWQPCSYPAGLASSVRASFTDAETVELVLDVARNAANKIAVAFGADEAHVTDGVEFYDVDEDGELVYALTPDPGR